MSDHAIAGPLAGPTFEMPEHAAVRRLLNPKVQAALPLEASTLRVRRATPRDLADCVRMAIRFAQESPYRELVPVNVAAVETLVAFLLDHGGAYVAQDDDGEVVGMIGAHLAPNPVSGELVACEAAWYLEPAHRGGATALRLLSAVESWARDRGALKFQMIAPAGETRLGEFYRRRGYVELETIFQRELH